MRRYRVFVPGVPVEVEAEDEQAAIDKVMDELIVTVELIEDDEEDDD